MAIEKLKRLADSGAKSIDENARIANDNFDEVYDTVEVISKTSLQSDAAAAINAVISAATPSPDSPLRIKLPSGRYNFTAPIILRSHTSLDLSSVTLNLTTGVNLITNRGRLNTQRTVPMVSVAADSFRATAPSGTFTAADIGRAIWASTGRNCTIEAYTSTHFTAIITEVISDTEVVLDAQPSMSVVNATVNIYDRDTGIHIITDANTRIIRDCPSIQGDNAEHSIVLIRCDDFSIGDLRIETTTGKYGILLSDVHRWTVGRLRPDCTSDCLHITGPASDGRVAPGIGHSGDDFFAVGCTDYAQYAETQGPCRNIVFEGVTGLKNSGGVHVFSGAGDKYLSASSIFFHDISGSFYNRVVGIDQSGSTGEILDNIHILHCAPTSLTPANLSAVVISGRTGHIHLHDLFDNGVTGTSPFVSVAGTNDSVNVNGIERTDKSRAVAMVNLLQSATSDTISFKGLRGVFNSATDADIVNLAGQCKSLVFDDYRFSGHAGVVFVKNQYFQNDLDVKVSNGMTSGLAGAYLFWLDGIVNININNSNFGPCHMAVRSGSAASRVTVRGSGVTWEPTIFADNGATGASVRLLTFAAYGEIDRPGIALNNGDMAFNTKASLSCGVGPVVCNGTAWKNLYTDAIYTPA